VKVEPLPNSLSTVKSPPIIWQNFRLIARPKPVPPYFLDALAPRTQNSQDLGWRVRLNLIQLRPNDPVSVLEGLGEQN
jgi:hypothetical protein